MMGRTAGVDVPAKSLKMDIPGHSGSYDLSVLVPVYGWSASKKLGAILASASEGLREATFASYFWAWRRFMLQGGLAADSNSASSAMFRMIRDGLTPKIEAHHVQTALMDVYHRIADFNDFSFTSSTNDKTRAGIWEGVRRFCSLLTRTRFLPPFSVSGTIAVVPGTRTPVLADVSRQAGRLPACSSWAEAEEQALKENIELLHELRDCLQGEFVEQLDLFRLGQKIINDQTLYSAEQIDKILTEEGEKSGKLGKKGSKTRLHLALKLFYSIIYEEYRCNANKYRVARFLTSVGGQKILSPLVGATAKAIHAAFVIVLIDTGWNLQPTTDLLRDPFVGKASRGKRKIKSVGSIKFRADSAFVTAPLQEYPQLQADLKVREKDGRISGVSVIESWLEMTGPLRRKAEKDGSMAANWLWIWREPFNGIAIRKMRSVDNCWWYAFLKRIRSHPRLGGLRITHQIIRKTVINIGAAEGVFNIRLPMALADHASEGMTQQYLTETTLHAVYAAKVRKFLDLWESVAAINIEQAARYLGINEEDLRKRQQLGLASGLDFALIKQTRKRNSLSTSAVPKGDSVFVISTEAMEKLHLARLALKQKGSVIQACNPSRWLRSWLPWQVIVDCYCELIEKSRFRTKFRRAVLNVEQRLCVEKDALPLVY